MKLFFISLCVSFLFTVSSAADSTDLQQITLQLNWKNQFQFAGYYMAKEKGYYKDAGLDVNILEYENGTKLAKEVTQNKHWFGVGRSGLVLDAINTNNIVLLSAVFQSSPYVLVSLKSSGINSVEQFKKKKIMIDSESIENTAFIAMLQSNGISFKAMVLKEPSFKVESLLNGDTNIAAWYLSNELYTLDKMGIKYDIWNPKDYGFDFYSDLLFTSKNELQNSPKIVENFRNASLQGWKYAFKHIDETVEVILKKYNTQNKTEGELLYEANTLKRLSYSGDQKLGTIKKEKIQRLIDIYNLLGFYKGNVNIDSFIYRASNQFFLTQEENKYIQQKKVIKFCVDPNWMPLDAIDKDGVHVGMAADILHLIQKDSGIKFELIPTTTWEKSLELVKKRVCDIVPMAMETPKRKKFLDFTTSYISSPMAIATKNSEIFIDSMKELQDKKVSLVKGYAYVELIKMKYPRIKIVEVDTLKQGLALVRKGEVEGHLESLATLAYALREESVTDVKIAGKFDDLWSLSIATRNDEPLLKTIMQKALDTIADTKIQNIYNKWLAIKFEDRIDYSLLYKIVSILALIILFVIWRYHEVRKTNKIIQRKNEEINKAYKQYAWLAENMDDVVWVMGIDSKFIYVSPSVEKLRGYTVEEVMQQSFEELICESSRENVINAMGASIETVQRGEMPLMKIVRVEQPCKDGSTVWTEVNSRLIVDEDTGEMRFIGLTRDITQNMIYEQQLEKLAVTDRLTNLYNRHKIDEMLQFSKDLADRHDDDSPFGVLLFDIDHFKQVNDVYGHQTGDITLQTFASILAKHSRKTDIVGRWGGEEFIILVPHITKESLIMHAENLRMKIEQTPFETVEHITASIGATLYCKTETTDETVNRADQALYNSKENGRNQVTFLGM
jgi:polar amino acid transport system substrate-binding protein